MFFTSGVQPPTHYSEENQRGMAVLMAVSSAHLYMRASNARTIRTVLFSTVESVLCGFKFLNQQHGFTVR